MTANLTFEAQVEALRRLAAVDWEVDLEVDWMADWMVDLKVGTGAVVVASKFGGRLLSGEESALMVLRQRVE